MLTNISQNMSDNLPYDDQWKTNIIIVNCKTTNSNVIESRKYDLFII